MDLAPLIAVLSPLSMLVVALGGLALLYLGFKAATLAVKLLLVLFAIVLLTGAGCYFLAGHAH